MPMIEINLLPKDYLKKSIDFSLGKAGVYSLVIASGIMLMLIGITFYQKYQLKQLDQNIGKARQRATTLQKDIRLVDALIDVKNKITLRMQAVEKLDSHRSAWVKIMEDLTRNVPEFVWLSTFQEKPEEKDKNPKDNKSSKTATSTPKGSSPTIRQGEIEGYSFTLNALASFMIKMMRSSYFDDVELLSTNEMNLQGKKAYNFILNFSIHYLSDEELRNMLGAVNEKKSSNKAKTTHKKLN